MRLSSVLFGVIIIIFSISLVCIWFYPSIQDFAASNNMWNGIKSATKELEADTVNSYSELPDLS